MDVKPFPPDLDPDRYVIALVVGLGLDSEGSSVMFQVDCCGITGERYPQAFVVEVPVESLDESSQLTMHQHFRVILDPAKKKPEYIQLTDGMIVGCDVTHEFGESRKAFEFIV